MPGPRDVARVGRQPDFPAANNASLARLARNGGTTVDGIPTPPPRLIQGARVY